MIQNLFRTITFAAGIALALCGPLGCADTPSASAEEPVASGRLQLPLTTELNGRVYRLNANIYIWQAGMVLSTGQDPSATVLSAELPTGTYTADMYYWNLERQDEAGGAFYPVSATLVSSSSAQFSIFNGTTTTISFTFEAASETVTVGAGGLNVTFDVTERAPACTALGDSCGEGYWCPPSQLTAALAACVPAGTTPLAESCNGPLDCVANATCIDHGAGARCTALCDASEFGAECAAGGVCEAVTAEYGICVHGVEE